MTLLKKQGIGAWISAAALLLAVVGLIIYAVATNTGNGLIVASGSQPFYDLTRAEEAVMIPMVAIFGILSVVGIVASIAANFFELEGIAGKVVDCVAGVLRIAVPAFLMLTFLYFVFGSFTGIAWTFFSNAELEIYPEATAVGQLVIVGLVLLLVASIASVVAAFLPATKKIED